MKESYLVELEKLTETLTTNRLEIMLLLHTDQEVLEKALQSDSENIRKVADMTKKLLTDGNPFQVRRYIAFLRKTLLARYQGGSK